MSHRWTWSIFKGSPSRSRESAGIISPNFMLIMSPGTRTAASSSTHCPSRRTYTFVIKTYFHRMKSLQFLQNFYVELNKNAMQLDQITLNHLRFWSKTSHEGSSSISSIVFLNETNGGVDYKKSNDTNKILPIWWFPLQVTSKVITCIKRKKKVS